MAAFDTTRSAPLGAAPIFRITQIVADSVAALISWNDARVTRKALNRLSDRELEDIGLCRADVDLIGR